MIYQESMFELKTKKPEEEKPDRACTWKIPEEFIFWPCAYGVKDAQGEWLCSFEDKRRATEVFENDPKAKQLIVGLEPLAGLESRPGRVVREK